MGTGLRPGRSEESRGQEGKSERRGWGITEHGELGPPRAQGGLRGLALVGGVVRQLGVRDLQVVLPGIRRAHDPVPRPGCRDTKGEGGEPRPSLGTGLGPSPDRPARQASLSPQVSSPRPMAGAASRPGHLSSLLPGLGPRPQSQV